MEIDHYLNHKKAFVFKLDNVLYPEKDYLLQVYYLFAEFMSYTEQLDAAKMIEYMQQEYLRNGDTEIFKKTATIFQIPLKYENNFLLLHQNARLPLKLLLYKQVLQLLQDLVVERKEIFLLVDGDPVQQLNKIKQMEWHGLEQYLKVYFSEEFAPAPSADSIAFIKAQHKLTSDELLIVGISDLDEQHAKQIGVDFFLISKLF